MRQSGKRLKLWMASKLMVTLTIRSHRKGRLVEPYVKTAVGRGEESLFDSPSL
jgi:hypothetical protein